MRLKKIGIILFVVATIYVLIFSPYGMVKIIQLRCQIHKTQTEIAILQGKKVALEYENNLLEHDTSYINYVAKEKFGIK
ncbi:MAG: septum formation initiator family protein [Candidatus Stahlbacteria bacterium]|nr:septum formation initiator family protein [Candidatus Stahlbacteria bacterium]